MALRDKIQKNAAGILQPGETIQQAFVGQTKSGWWAAFGLIGMLIARTRMRPVLATNERIVVCDGSMWSATKVNGVIGQVPRTTNLGEPTGLWWRCDALGDEMFIHKRFHKDVRAINAG